MKIGDTFTVQKTVTEDMTAAALGSGGLPVFGLSLIHICFLRKDEKSNTVRVYHRRASGAFDTA